MLILTLTIVLRTSTSTSLNQKNINDVKPRTVLGVRRISNSNEVYICHSTKYKNYLQVRGYKPPIVKEYFDHVSPISKNTARALSIIKYSTVNLSLFPSTLPCFPTSLTSSSKVFILESRKIRLTIYNLHLSIFCSIATIYKRRWILKEIIAPSLYPTKYRVS